MRIWELIQALIFANKYTSADTRVRIMLNKEIKEFEICSVMYDDLNNVIIIRGDE